MALVYTMMSLDERQSVVDSFHDNMETERDGDEGQDADNGTKILLSTTQLLSTIFACTKAFRENTPEPDDLKGKELQAVARISRFGQRNPMTYSYRLICTEQQIERLIIERQTFRGTCMLVDAEVAGTNLDMLALASAKQIIRIYLYGKASMDSLLDLTLKLYERQEMS